MQLEFESDVFLWEARTASWFFGTVPPELSEQIRELAQFPGGFGSLKVNVQIGRTSWSTSIFPDSSRGAYVLPLKKAVRDAEGITADSVITVRLEVLGI